MVSSTEHEFNLLINVKMPTIKPENSINLGYFVLYEQLKFHA